MGTRRPRRVFGRRGLAWGRAALARTHIIPNGTTKVGPTTSRSMIAKTRSEIAFHLE
jgi:hypothetical protein